MSSTRLAFALCGSFCTFKEAIPQMEQLKKRGYHMTKLEEMQNKYYKQFTAMESAMSSLQSQQSYISQLFAG